MEALVYKKTHWMDDPAKAVRVAELRKDPLFEAKYQRRYQKGDIIEVREDGFWSGGRARGYNTEAFELVRCPGVDMADKTEPLYEDDILHNEKVTKRRRKYSINTAAMIGDSLSEAQFNSRLTEKTNG